METNPTGGQKNESGDGSEWKSDNVENDLSESIHWTRHPIFLLPNFVGLGLFFIGFGGGSLSVIWATIKYLKFGDWEYAENSWILSTWQPFALWISSTPTDWIGAHKFVSLYLAYIPVSVLISLIGLLILAIIPEE